MPVFAVMRPSLFVHVHGEESANRLMRRAFIPGLASLRQDLPGDRGSHTQVRQAQVVLLDGELQFPQVCIPLRLMAIEGLGAELTNPVCQASGRHQ